MDQAKPAAEQQLMRFFIYISVVYLITSLQAFAGCDTEEAPCQIPLGEYHIATPEGDGPHPVVVFLHGAGGKGQGAIRMGGPMLERGYAVIGPQGIKRPGSRFGSSWSFHPDRKEIRDELAFVRQVIEDATKNHSIDPEQVLLAGFSIGGSMTSYLACKAPDLAKAYAPVAGGFWRPHPELNACKGSVKLLHTHGWKDKTVPLEGRPLGGGRIYQGDVFVTMQIWREANGCINMRADEFEIKENFWHRTWTSCEEGALEFVLHPGAHGIPKGWGNMALDWFESLDQPEG